MTDDTLKYEIHRYSHDKSSNIRADRFSDKEFRAIVKDFKKSSKKIEQRFDKLRPTKEQMRAVYGAVKVLTNE